MILSFPDGVVTRDGSDVLIGGLRFSEQIVVGDLGDSECVLALCDLGPQLPTVYPDYAWTVTLNRSVISGWTSTLSIPLDAAVLPAVWTPCCHPVLDGRGFRWRWQAARRAAEVLRTGRPSVVKVRRWHSSVRYITT